MRQMLAIVASFCGAPGAQSSVPLGTPVIVVTQQAEDVVKQDPNETDEEIETTSVIKQPIQEIVRQEEQKGLKQRSETTRRQRLKGDNDAELRRLRTEIYPTAPVSIHVARRRKFAEMVKDANPAPHKNPRYVVARLTQHGNQIIKQPR